MKADIPQLDVALENCLERLRDARKRSGHWEGGLSSSALSTATAAFALSLHNGPANQRWIEPALRWLCRNQNRDGGWGDSVDSPSNVATTLLGYSALGLPLAKDWAGAQTACDKAAGYLTARAGGLSGGQLAQAMFVRYGKDRTFSVPILTMAALAGRLGRGEEAWRFVLPLPFELAAMPRTIWKWLHLPVVSYAAPALIAIGQARFHHAPPAWPMRAIRQRAIAPTLRMLENMQPADGGFLEAAPLTSFVLMSLCSTGLAGHPVAQKASEFLRFTVRPDGSWPIDTNLSMWVTTLAIGAAGSEFSPEQRHALRDWLLTHQVAKEHPYTVARPGGWAWTDLSGGVPDADDTAGALLGLADLEGDDPSVVHAAQAGVSWLLEMQNRDGGMPTFCRGWGKLPFDRSTPDVTAHALRAWAQWRGRLSDKMRVRTTGAMRRAMDYLRRSQAPDGGWVPLWFGSQATASQENRVFGTSRVLLGLERLSGLFASPPLVLGGCAYLLRNQNADGGWGAEAGVASGIEETAVATEALAGAVGTGWLESEQADAALLATGDGAAWLMEHTAQGRKFPASPIGLYFAKLWYSEALYPLIFTISALRRARAVLGRAT